MAYCYVSYCLCLSGPSGRPATELMRHSCPNKSLSICLSIFHRFESQEQDLQAKITSLEQELAHANDLLAASKQYSSLQGEVLALSPAAAKASALLKSGLSLTQIYSQYVEVSEELVREKEETARLGNLLEHINQELEEKTPALQQVGGRERGGGSGGS